MTLNLYYPIFIMKFYSRPSLIIVCLVLTSLFIFASKALLTHKGTSQYFPDAVYFSDEPAPLNTIDIKERFDRELLINANLHSSTLLILKRANRYFPVIEPILKQNAVPDDFKYLCVIESALTNATSPAGARGFWQFMPETAKEKGMEINESVDERYHLAKATQAACDYLLAAKQKFGSWTLAAASYNGGMNGIAKSLEAQKVTNYYDLLLTEETQRYVFRILALKEIMQNPKSYGFNLEKNELYEPIPTKIIEIDSTVSDLAEFSKLQGINYKILKIHNPWLRDKKLLNTSNKKYLIEIPTAGY